MLRSLLRPVALAARSALGTNGLAARLAAAEAKIDAIGRDAEWRHDEVMRAAFPAAPPAGDVPPVSLLMHHGRGALMRDMPPGARRLLSAGCAGLWYFEWIEQTYGPVEEHLGIEFYMPKPDGLPANVTWIANTVGNMAAVETGSCDLVVSGQNIEHLWPDEVADFLVESARVLRPGGTLCVDSPNRTVTSLLNWSHPEHTVELTVPETRRLLELAGFDVTKEAGVWLCRDPRTGRVLPFDPGAAEADWTVTERLVSARDKPEHAMLWWLEARRSARAPDRAAVGAAVDAIFAHAWPERTQRLIVAPGRTTEQREDGRWVIVPAGSAGVVFYGPYMPLRAGRYRVVFDMEGEAGAARFDVAAGADGVRLAEAVSEPGAAQVAIEFELPELKFGCQFRCFSEGGPGFAVRLFVGLTEWLPTAACS